MSEKIKNTLNECKKYKDIIMNEIHDILSYHEYEFSTNSKGEIVVQTPDLTKINDIISSEIEIPSYVKNILIDTYKTQSKVYIRLKFI